MNRDVWLALGYARGWCGPAVCETHDGTPTSEAEDAALEAGGDPCVPIVRLYDVQADKLAVEAWHSPSVWRTV